jgi:hypothetical protein
MTRERPDSTTTKLERHRNAKRHKGMKRVRIWVPDPTAPGFREEAERQAALLRGAPEELEALRFIEAVRWPDE